MNRMVLSSLLGLRRWEPGLSRLYLYDERGAAKSTGPASLFSLEALADRQSISLGVLEPGGFRAAARRDAVLHPDSGHVVFLEHHAPSLELGHFGLDVAHLPERLAGFRRPRVFRRIHEDFGAAAFVDHAAGVFLLRRK